MNHDFTSINGIINFIVSLLQPAEWRLLGLALAYTYATTYVLNVAYKAIKTYRKPIAELNPNVIRLIALFSGFLATYTVWDHEAISMNWYQAGIFIGPLSILIHHVLLGLASNSPINKLAPWLYPIIKGPGSEKRKGNRAGPADRAET